MGEERALWRKQGCFLFKTLRNLLFLLFKMLILVCKTYKYQAEISTGFGEKV